MTKERRHAPRIRAYLPLQLQLRDAPGVVETLTKDIGTGGVRCLSPRPVPVASEFGLHVFLGRSLEPLSGRGQVRWFRSLPYSDQFELGIAFEALSESETRRLSTCLDRMALVPAEVGT